MRVGGQYVTVGTPGTLDGYLKGCTSITTAGWVAVVLEQAGIVELDHGRPLQTGSRPTTAADAEKSWQPPLVHPSVTVALTADSKAPRKPSGGCSSTCRTFYSPDERICWARD